MIVITGAAGFIGSCVARFFKEKNAGELVIVDDFSRSDKQANLLGIQDLERVERDQFFDWAQDKSIDWIIHLGARTDTTEMDYSIFETLNLDYSKSIWTLCLEKEAGLIYASSAATYGDGEQGYSDDHQMVERLLPMNPYGRSKNEFDKWVLDQAETPHHWYGLKFFNVFGPNEYHKGRMASVVFHAFRQIQETGMMKLFRSHRDEYEDGMQLRDFVYVKDVCEVIGYLFGQSPASGLYNLGTGRASTFLDLTRAVFEALDVPENIEFIDIPEDIRDKYQYFTEADMQKLSATGYDKSFYELRDAVADYVTNYLVSEAYY